MPKYETNKVDNSSTLPAAEYNQYGVGHNNLVTSSGQTPTTGAPDQYSQAVAQYATDGDYYVDSGSSTNAYVAITHTARKGVFALTAGVQIRFIPLVANTAAATINVNGLGVKDIKAQDGTSDLSAGDMAAGQVANLFYDGTNFRLLKPQTAGLPIDYIKDIITWASNTTIDWEGSARSDDNTTDLVAASPITATLAGAVANTTYHMFVGLDAGSALVAEFDTNLDGSGLSNITGAKRRVGSFVTDGSSNLISFVSYVDGTSLKVLFDSSIAFGGIPINTNNQLIKVPGVPDDIGFNAIFSLFYINSDVPTPKSVFVGHADSGAANHLVGINRPFSHGSSPYITDIITNTSAQVYVRIDNAAGVETYEMHSHGYKDVR